MYKFIAGIVKGILGVNGAKAKVYGLENLKLVYTESTNGRFVTKDKELIKKFKEEYAKELTDKYLKNMEDIGLTYEDVKKIIGGK